MITRALPVVPSKVSLRKVTPWPPLPQAPASPIGAKVAPPSVVSSGVYTPRVFSSVTT